MACARISSILELVTKDDRVYELNLGTEKVAVLLAADLFYAYISDNPSFSKPKYTLENWTRVKRMRSIPLGRDGDISVRTSPYGPKHFTVSRASDNCEWEFVTSSVRETETWVKLITSRITPMIDMLPKRALDTPVPLNWVFVPPDISLRLLSAEEVGPPTRRNLSVEWLQLILTEAETIIGGFEPLLSWAPLIGIGIHLLGYGVGLLSRAARQYQNRERIIEARTVMERIAKDVLNEFERCAREGGADQRRFITVAGILTALENVLRVLDRYELSRSISRFRKTNVPEELLEKLEELGDDVSQLSLNVDVDIINVKLQRVIEVGSDVFQTLQSVRKTIERLEEEVEERGALLQNSLPETVLEAISESVSRAILRQIMTPAMEESRLTGPEGSMRRLKSAERWKGGSFAPSLSSRIVFNFENSNSLESQIREAILHQDVATTALGFSVSSASVGICGPAGVGKTTATIAVLADKQVRSRFKDGIFFVQLSHKTTSRDIITAWSKMIRNAVGNDAGTAVREMTSIDQAMNLVEEWFHEKRTLICVDNVWAVNTNTSGETRRDEWLWRFVNIAGGTSTVVFTTREEVVAVQNGSRRISAKQLKWDSSRAMNIFDRWLMLPPSEKHLDNPSAKKFIMQNCGGLPLALSVAASSVCISDYDWQYVIDLFSDGALLNQYGPALDRASVSLYNAINVTIEVLQNHKPLYEEMFRKLVVFPRKARVPLDVLASLWECSPPEARRNANALAGFALAEFTKRRVDGLPRLELHESVFKWLEYHVRHGQGREDPRSEILEYHRTLLRNFASRAGLLSDSENSPLLKAHGGESIILYGKPLGRPLPELGIPFENIRLPVSQSASSSIEGNTEHHSGELDLDRIPWWLMEGNHAGTYMYENIVHHLIQAGFVDCACNLLTDMRWIRRRIELTGAALSVKDDLDTLAEGYWAKSGNRAELPARARYVRSDSAVGLSDITLRLMGHSDSYGHTANRSLTKDHEVIDILMIKGALEGASPALARDPDQCAFQLCGRLISLASDSDGPTAIVVQSAAETVPRPCFLPEWQTFESPTDHLRQSLETRGQVNCISVSPKAHIIAVGMHRGVVQLWDWDSAQLVDVLAVKSVRDINSISWLCSGTELVVGASDSNAYVFTVNVPESPGFVPPSDSIRKTEPPFRSPLVTCPGHSGPIAKVAVSPLIDENSIELIATGSADHDIRLFNSKNGMESSCLRGHTQRITDLIWLQLWNASIGILSASADRTVRLFDKSGRTLRIFKGHSDVVNGVVSLSPVQPNHFASCSLDGTVKIWDLRNGDISHDFRGKKEAIMALAAVPGTSKLVAASQFFRLHTWNWKKGKAGVVVDRAHSGRISCLEVAIRPEGSRVLSGSQSDGTCKIWDLSGVQEESAMSHHVASAPVNAVTVLNPCVSSDEDTDPVVVSFSEYGGISSWNIRNGVCKESVAVVVYNDDEKECNEISVVTPLAIDGLLATGSVYGAVTVWRVEESGKLERVRSLGMHASKIIGLACVDKSHSLISVCDNTEVRMWNIETGKFKTILKEKKRGICTAFAATESGSFLCVGLNGGNVALCSTETNEYWWLSTKDAWGSVLALAATEAIGSKIRVVLSVQDGTLRIFEGKGATEVVHVGTLRGLGHVEKVSLSFVPGFQGKWLVSGSSFDHTLRLWDTETEELGDNAIGALFIENRAISRRASRRSPPTSRDDSFWDLLTTPLSAEARQGDSTVLTDMGTSVLSCQCFRIFKTGIDLGVAIGRVDGTVTVVRLRIV